MVNQTLRRMVILACLLVVGLVPITWGGRSVAAHVECPPGEVPAEFVSFGDLYLPEGAPPYTKIFYDRRIVPPGGSLTFILPGPVLYYVVSGILKYDSQAGVAIQHASPCMPDSGHYSSFEGSTEVDEENRILVTEGQTVVAVHGITGPISNGGSEPLVLLRVGVIIPDIDPVSGLPLADPTDVGMEYQRSWNQRAQECKEARERAELGTPTPDDILAQLTEPVATPAVSTAEWSGNDKPQRRTIPRACENLTQLRE